MKLFFAVVLSFMLVIPAYAMFDDNSTNQDQQQGQIGINRNDNTNLQGQSQGMISDNENTNRNNNDNENTNLQGQAQGQGQGQIAVGKVKTDQANAQSVNVEGDTMKTYVMTAPNTVANKGQSAFSGYSIFGGINLAESEEATTCMEKIICISQMQQAGLLTQEEAVSEAKLAFQQLKDSTKPKRILGFGPTTRGRHLFNVFGILATDNWISENQQEVKTIRQKTEDKELTGNRGNL